MAELSVQDISRSGLNPTLGSAASGGDTVDQGTSQEVFLYVDNQDASSKEVTVTAENTDKEVPGWGTLSISDVVVSVPAGETRFIGPFPRNPFTTTLSISYDAVTSLNIAAVRLPREP